jgi:RNA polymerase sigma-70 factor (ECF subfamily)
MKESGSAANVAESANLRSASDPLHQATAMSRDTPTEAMGFHTTHWTVVLTAGAGKDTVATEALANLCSSYWYPLYAFVRRSGLNRHDAEDLTQGFFYSFLRRDSLAQVNPQAGKFRSYLLASLKNFMANERRRSQAQRRGAGVQEVSLDAEAAETRYLAEPADNLTPDLLFERRWAFTVLDQVLERLRHEYTQRDKAALFDDLRALLPGDAASVPRPELAARHGMSVGALDVALHRLRQRFGVLLREQVVRTVSSPDEVGEELRYLISVLGA